MEMRLSSRRQKDTHFALDRQHISLRDKSEVIIHQYNFIWSNQLLQFVH